MQAVWRRMAKYAYMRQVRGELLCARSIAVQRNVIRRLRNDCEIDDVGIRRAENDLLYKDPQMRLMQDEERMFIRAYQYAIGW